MCLGSFLYSSNFSENWTRFQNEPIRFQNELNKSIRSIAQHSLNPNIEQLEKKSLSQNLKSIQSIIEKPNSGIENIKEIIHQVKEITTCLENDISYARRLWDVHEVHLDEEKLVFSDSLKNILDDECFEFLIQAIPEENLEKVTNCSFEGLSLGIKSVVVLLKHLPNISKEALEKIMMHLEEPDLLNIREIWPLFEGMSLKERSNIVSCALNCFQNSMSEDEKPSIVEAIVAIPIQDRENILTLALQCFCDDRLENDRSRIIRAIAKSASSAYDRENIVSLSRQYFYDGISGREKAQLIEVIGKIVVQDCENILKLSSECFNKDGAQIQKAEIIEAIAKVAIQDRANVIFFAQQCFCEGAVGFDKATVIGIIAGSIRDFQDPENILDFAVQCFHHGISGEDRAYILVAMARITGEDREDVLKWSLKCFDEDTTGAGKTRVIEAITEIAIEDRESILNLSLECFNGRAVKNDKSHIIRAITAITTQNRAHAVALAVQCFHESMTGLDRGMIINTIARNGSDFQDRENFVSLAIQHFDDGMSGDVKNGIIQIIAKIAVEDREDVLKWSLECFDEDIEKNSKIQIIEAIAAVTAQDRKGVLEFAIQHFYKGIPGYDKAGIINAIANVAVQDRKDVLKSSLGCFNKDSVQVQKGSIITTIALIDIRDRDGIISLAAHCFFDGMSGLEKASIIRAITQSADNSQDREKIVALAVQCFCEGVSGIGAASIINVIAKIAVEDRENVIKWSLECFSGNVLERNRAKIITAIAAIAAEDRENIVTLTVQCFYEDITVFKVADLLTGFSIIPKDERSFIQSSSMQDFIKRRKLNKITLLCAYLLPASMRSMDVLLNLDKYGQELIASLERKLADETLSQRTLIGLAEYAEGRYKEKLPEEHPLMQRVIELLAINTAVGIKNPFTFFKQLKELRNTPTDFEPLIGETIPLRINMAQLKNMALASKIQREDLPEKATKEAWESFINIFRSKTTKDDKNAKIALERLTTNWAEIEWPLFKDPQNYLMGVFDLKGPVSDTEAKLKAIFNNILDKNNSPRDGEFFTEQEEVFIKTMMIIQHCTGGKQEGIARAYELLDSAYKYKLKLSSPVTADELMEVQKKEEVRQFLSNFIQNTEEITEKELIQCFNKNTYENSGLFSSLFGFEESSQYFIEIEEDNEFIYQLNEEGARAALSYIRDVKKKELVDYIAEILRPVLERTISNDAFIQNLAGEIDFRSQGVHYSIYLKNIIGYLIGVTAQLVFDRHVGNLNSLLLEKSREDILKLFFTQITPEILVSELMQKGIPAVFMKLFLNTEKLTKNGAINLLEEAEYLVR